MFCEHTSVHIIRTFTTETRSYSWSFIMNFLHISYKCTGIYFTYLYTHWTSIIKGVNFCAYLTRPAPLTGWSYEQWSIRSCAYRWYKCPCSLPPPTAFPPPRQPVGPFALTQRIPQPFMFRYSCNFLYCPIKTYINPSPYYHKIWWHSFFNFWRGGGCGRGVEGAWFSILWSHKA